MNKAQKDSFYNPIERIATIALLGLKDLNK
jgi:hypothetical protein